ncbi:MAG: response regulator [Clostridiales bacterium]|jgi:YesN/AraC family two-component response regulator|nr:response regulator [Clostridiales bacterium]MDR2751790.1 response regulator [Clostridiales bacterium]
MYSLVISDDETKQRQGLLDFIDWESLGFRVVADFSDGADLLGYLKREKVDAVLTDIMMMEISGLDIAEFVHMNCKDMAVVLISGYKDFDFARKAIELNVWNYIIKPAQIEEINRVFTDVKKKLDDLRSMRKPNFEDKIDTGNIVIDKAKEYIIENCSRDVSLQEVAEHVYLNPAYFSRFFKLKTGENFIDFLLAARMEKAKALLSEKRLKIHEIGEKVGYPNPKYFSKVFRDSVGCSPKEYARRLL